MADLPPVETLRAAAERLRNLAAGTTDAPWELSQTSTLYMNGQGVYHLRTAGVPGTRATLTSFSTDARWVVGVHPGVAEPLAAWLEDAASDFEAERRDEPVTSCEDYALKFARVLLGAPDGN